MKILSKFNNKGLGKGLEWVVVRKPGLESQTSGLGHLMCDLEKLLNHLLWPVCCLLWKQVITSILSPGLLWGLNEIMQVNSIAFGTSVIIINQFVFLCTSFYSNTTPQPTFMEHSLWLGIVLSSEFHRIKSWVVYKSAFDLGVLVL